MCLHCSVQRELMARRFCPCHGSHYDICTLDCNVCILASNDSVQLAASARVLPRYAFRVAVAVFQLTFACQLNLEIPPYDFSDGKLVIG